MANTILIIGESGTGKSASMRNLNPEECAVINVMNKTLPFKSAKKFPAISADNYKSIVDALERLSQNQTKKIIIIDDFQYLMANAWMRSLLAPKTKDSEFQKYKEIGFTAWDIIMKAKALPNDKTVFFLSHSETDETGKSQCKTIGKLLNEKVCIEGMFTVVLNTEVHTDKPINNRYFFQTQNTGRNTSKSPMGMFESELIPNDLSLVIQSIKNYEEE